VLENYWKDTRKTRVLSADHLYARSKEGGDFNAQEYFINHYTR